MKSSSQSHLKPVAVLLAFLLAFPASEAGLARAQQAPQSGPQVAPEPVGSTSQNSQLAKAADPEALPEAPAPSEPQTAGTSQQPAASQPGDAQPQRNPRKPVGAAAAPYEPTLGIAASRPAGAAIAPAKQRRVRTILISLGVIAGAGIAVGSVAALSHGSPSRP